MESGIRIFLLTAALCSAAGCATTGQLPASTTPAADSQDASQGEASPDENSPPPRVIQPDIERHPPKVAAIHSSNVEVGLSYGALSIEDFGTNPVYGGSLAYHVTEDFFARAEIGRSTAGESSFETLSQIQLLSNADRRFTYYDIALGYNFLPGEAFIGSNTALTSTFYVTGGIGGTDFAGDTKLTAVFGAGYQVIPTDWLAVHIEVQDHIFQSSIFGVSKLTNNLEARLVTSFYF